MKIILLIFISATLSITSHAKDIKMSALQNKPYFTIKIESYGASYLVHVNGVNIYREFDDNSQISTSIPVNHYMSPDNNLLELEALPPEQGGEFNPNSYINITLKLSQNDMKEHLTTISSLKFSGKNQADEAAVESSNPGRINSITGDYDNKGDIIVDDISYGEVKDYAGGISISRKLVIPSSLPRWAFLDSEELPDLEPLSDEDYYAFMKTLLNEYLKVQNAIKNKTTDSITGLFSERSTEIDKAYYLKPGTTISKIKSSLSDASTDPDLELVELDINKVDFTVQPNNKLVSLTRVGLVPAITLNFKSGFGSQRYDLIFRKNGDKWILSR